MSTPPITPVDAPRVWRSDEMARRDDWIVAVPDDVLSALERGVAEAKALGKDGNTMDCKNSGDYGNAGIPLLREFAAEVSDRLADGSGFCLLRGVPVDHFEIDELKMLLLVLGKHMGIIAEQAFNAPGISEVMDLGLDEKTFYYHRGGALPFHMDPVDVVGLLCVRKAKRGGESGIASSMAVHNEILRTRPDLLEILYRGYHHIRRHDPANQGKRLLTDEPCPVFADIGGEVICDLLPEAVHAAEKEGLIELTPAEREALDYAAEVAARPDMMLTMDIEPGDIQFLNNRAILHNRLDYEDYAEPERRRLLLRLWLTMPGWRKYPANIPHTDMELRTTPS